jgi:hypothetical protein
MHAHRQERTRGGWPTRCACVVALAFATAWVIACAPPGGTRARVPRGSVTGRAASAVGDSGIFASPVQPYGVRPVVPHADAESAAVAMAYMAVSSIQDFTVPYYHTIPTERRRFCGRSYYVRPVVAMPDTTVVRSTGNGWMMWAPTWVIPICDDEGIVRNSVGFTDLSPRLRVRQGAGPHDVPELVPDSGTFPHITPWHAEFVHDWERGIGMTPETAVAVVTAVLEKSGAHAAEVPEAFTSVRLLDPSPPMVRSPRVFGDLAICPRWRLTLDRRVTVRGSSSGRVVRTRTLYVTRSGSACYGVPLVQLPALAQPATVPFMYVQPVWPPRRMARPPDPELRWTTLRAIEPLWFEEARLAR